MAASGVRTTAGTVGNRAAITVVAALTRAVVYGENWQFVAL